MTAKRYPVDQGRLRKKTQDPKDPVWKCRKCGREWFKVSRRWVASSRLL